MPLQVALTGNIAAGKSSVASLFREWGATVFDADATVRALQQPGTPVFQEILRRFGPGVQAPDGGLDRAALRARVLADPAERRALEQIVHPAVRAERERRLGGGGSGPLGITVSEIPLLFEAADPAEFDLVVLADAPEALRRERLRRDRGLSGAEAEALLAAQLSPAAKRARADFVIDNDGSRDQLRERAWLVWRKLLARARGPA